MFFDELLKFIFLLKFDLKIALISVLFTFGPFTVRPMAGLFTKTEIGLMTSLLYTLVDLTQWFSLLLRLWQTFCHRHWFSFQLSNFGIRLLAKQGYAHPNITHTPSRIFLIRHPTRVLAPSCLKKMTTFLFFISWLTMVVTWMPTFFVLKITSSSMFINNK